jgi:hypothetical protein
LGLGVCGKKPEAVCGLARILNRKDAACPSWPVKI